ncbi:---NA--- [Paramuricea clavata]|uniref:---NA n=1 Tax=Paramuricea clavata TaxID=317549 RepID=A0A6S7K7E4_PARCT|nr:---NA--- [Paramuricea clavata]
MIEEIDNEGLEYAPDESIGFLKIICKKHAINFDKFVNNMLDWIDEKHQKKNCLYFYGPSNAMKSMIANSIKKCGSSRRASSDEF